jgi:hypothetical protein
MVFHIWPVFAFDYTVFVKVQDVVFIILGNPYPTPIGYMVKYEVRSPKFIWAPMFSCTHWLRPRNIPPPPLHLGFYTRRYWSARIYRRHLFVTSCQYQSIEIS